MYFKILPKTRYTFKNSNIKNIRCVNIFKRVSVNFDETATRSFSYYDVMPGDTPEIISSRMYRGNPYWYWAILMFNGITNPFTEMARDDESVVNWQERQYGTMGSLFFDEPSEVFPSFTQTREPRVGDIIVKINSDGTLPDAYTDTLESFQVVEFIPERHELRFLTDKENGTFSAGDKFAVIEKSNGNYSVVYKNAFLKRVNHTKDGVVNFKDPNGKKLTPNDQTPAFSMSANENPLDREFKETILGTFLGASGSTPWGSAESQGYRSMNGVESTTEENNSLRRIKIPDARLLQPMLSEMSKVFNKPPTENKHLISGR